MHTTLIVIGDDPEEQVSRKRRGRYEGAFLGGSPAACGCLAIHPGGTGVRGIEELEQNPEIPTIVLEYMRSFQPGAPERVDRAYRRDIANFDTLASTVSPLFVIVEGKMHQPKAFRRGVLEPGFDAEAWNRRVSQLLDLVPDDALVSVYDVKL